MSVEANVALQRESHQPPPVLPQMVGSLPVCSPRRGAKFSWQSQAAFHCCFASQLQAGQKKAWWPDPAQTLPSVIIIPCAKSKHQIFIPVMCQSCLMMIKSKDERWCLQFTTHGFPCPSLCWVPAFIHCSLCSGPSACLPVRSAVRVGSQMAVLVKILHNLNFLQLPTPSSELLIVVYFSTSPINPSIVYLGLLKII